MKKRTRNQLLRVLLVPPLIVVHITGLILLGLMLSSRWLEEVASDQYKAIFKLADKWLPLEDKPE